MRRAGPSLGLPCVLVQDLEQGHLPKLGTVSHVLFLFQQAILKSQGAGHHYLLQGLLEFLALFLIEVVRVHGAAVAVWDEAALRADHPQSHLHAAMELLALAIESPALCADQLVYLYFSTTFEKKLAPQTNF